MNLFENASPSERRAYWVNIAVWLLVLVVALAARVANYPTKQITPYSGLAVTIALAYAVWVVWRQR